MNKKKRRSNILKYMGDLAHLDDGRPWAEIKEEAGRKNAVRITKKSKRLMKKANFVATVQS